MHEAVMHLAALHCYPVKGLRGIDLASTRIEPEGLAFDRRWMVVDESGRFLSQRQLPRMARIDTLLNDGQLSLGLDGERIDISPAATHPDRIAVTVWRSHLHAVCPDPDADRWLSARLGRSCRLVFLDDAHARPIEAAYARPGEHVSFADGFPLLATTTASLAALNASLRRPVGMDRFRPNLVIEGAAAWAEDGWACLRIGALRFRAPKSCTRCIVTTIDQASGEIPQPGEPLRTLGKLNRHADGIVFGRNLIPDGPGRLSIGDAVEILS